MPESRKIVPPTLLCLAALMVASWAATVPMGYTDNVVTSSSTRGTTMTVDPATGFVYYVLMFETNITRWDGMSQTTFLASPNGTALWGMAIDGPDMYFGDNSGNIWKTNIAVPAPQIFATGLSGRAGGITMHCNGTFMVAGTQDAIYIIDQGGVVSTAVASRGIETACTTTDRIIVATSTTTILEVIPPNGSAVFTSGLDDVCGLTVHPATGDIYAATEGNNSLARIDSSGSVLDLNWATAFSWSGGWNPSALSFSDDATRMWYHDRTNTLRYIDGFPPSAGADILLVDTAPAQVAPGQTGIQVDVMVQNTHMTETANVTAVDLTMTGMADRTAEYTVVPDPGNPTTIAAGATSTFTFAVSVDAMATEETVIVDATFTGQFTPSMQAIMSTGSAMTDTWDVTGARIEARTVDAVDAMVSQGSTAHRVTVTLENTGLTDWSPTALQLSFTGTMDRTAEYVVMATPGNPTSVAAGSMETFNLDVDVDSMATVETITLDTLVVDGTDQVTGRTQGDTTADITDTWDVVPCLTTLCGDCNLDGMVTILDALLGAQHSAALITLVGAGFTNCNVIGAVEPDMAAAVTILDALTVAQAAAGLPVTLSCC